MVRPEYNHLKSDFWVEQRKMNNSGPMLCLHYRNGEDDYYPFVNAVRELKLQGPPAKRTLLFGPNPNPNRKRSITKLVYQYELPSETLKVLSIRVFDRVVTIRFTELGVDQIIEAFVNWIENKRDDFLLSTGHESLPKKKLGSDDRTSGELWFWGHIYSA